MIQVAPGWSFGISLSNRAVALGWATARELIRLAVVAERSGVVGSAWVGDSLTVKPRLEAVVTVAALAAATDRIRLGTACLATISMRHPLVLAAQWASVDRLSEGRTDLAVCIGGTGPRELVEREYAAMAVARGERVARMVESVQIIRALWTGEEVEFAGRFYRLSGSSIGFTPVQKRCPIWIASGPRDPALIERVYRRVARYGDSWMTGGMDPESFGPAWGLMRALRTEEKGDLEGFRSALHLRCHVDSDRDRAYVNAKAFLDSYYRVEHDRHQLEKGTVIGTLEDCVEKFVGYAEAGCNVIIIRLLGLPLGRQLDIWTQEVIPEVMARVGHGEAISGTSPAGSQGSSGDRMPPRLEGSQSATIP